VTLLKPLLCEDLLSDEWMIFEDSAYLLPKYFFSIFFGQQPLPPPTPNPLLVNCYYGCLQHLNGRDQLSGCRLCQRHLHLGQSAQRSQNVLK
jgi:hypothetical protein